MEPVLAFRRAALGLTAPAVEGRERAGGAVWLGCQGMAQWALLALQRLGENEMREDGPDLGSLGIWLAPPKESV